MPWSCTCYSLAPPTPGTLMLTPASPMSTNSLSDSEIAYIFDTLRCAHLGVGVFPYTYDAQAFRYMRISWGEVEKWIPESYLQKFWFYKSIMGQEPAFLMVDDSNGGRTWDALWKAQPETALTCLCWKVIIWKSNNILHPYDEQNFSSNFLAICPFYPLWFSLHE